MDSTKVVRPPWANAGVGKGGTGVLRVDGADVDTKQIPHTIAFLITFDETFDVGMDTRSGVNDADYHVPFAFTGKINKITVKPGPEQFTEEDRQIIRPRACCSQGLESPRYNQGPPQLVALFCADRKCDVR
jgi:hypothetical protein